MAETSVARVGTSAIDQARLAIAPGSSAEAVASGQVYELRQYKIFCDRRDAFIELFERELFETQKAVGIGMLGQFRDLDDPDRFTWIRSFETMAQREQALQAFYYGPVWAAHRDEANPFLEDNDNVLLLRPVGTHPALERRQFSADGNLIFVTIHYLWKDPAEGFADFFEAVLRPAVEASGLPVLAAFVSEPSENTFPQLPVRQSEKVFVWITRATSAEDYTAATAVLGQHGAAETPRCLAHYEERQRQVLRLHPTAHTRAR